MANTIVGHLNKRAIGVHEFRRRVPIDAFATLLSRVDAEQVTVTAARGLLDDVLAGTADASTVFASGGSALSSAEALLPMVRAVMVEHPGPVAQYRAGRVATLGFLVGQVMKQSGGQAAPQTVQRLRQELLAAEQ